MTTKQTDAIKLAIEALQSSQDYVDAAANAQFLAGWGEQMDKAAAAIKALAALQALDPPVAPHLQFTAYHTDDTQAGTL